MLKKLLEYSKYRITNEKGNHNIIHNSFYLLMALVYAFFSWFELFRGFDITSEPNYVMIVINIACLYKIYLSDRISLRNELDELRNKVKKNEINNVGEFDIPRGRVRLVGEGAALVVEIILIVSFALLNRLAGASEPYVSYITSIKMGMVLFDAFVVLFTLFNDVFCVARDMFEAESRTFQEIHLKEVR